ncbi:hypothetical protein SMACR_00041 [Sordaria macrospora]|uniref:WGS project CABT00000000 data, contig 2.1 n=2 Tax=Sordaria macrospora TaxID=5147 RepID=F7VJZ8_SORMK|nr:uncharacterized protein SMAC_00041 [Sordaria macrospora k-hell]KAA8624247.1 hypothetical protein SMACR_00041 [Sordaria macrospora]KAH7636106.1 hypothetical protein B0T09DRAFT_317780 [Sordaria sp. MPI-SDFR-AT-0083]WPJ64553.1 hypothetical protein SMAC4_00041 [Sordaria macrospora]CCC05825.1 unnamed protein product [Sordaria macrospora k-hell]
MVNFTRAAAALALAATVSAAPASTTVRATETTSEITWTVSDFDFHADYIFTTPAHQNSWGYVNFALSSDKTDLVYSCSTASNRLSDFFYGETDYQCTAPEGAAEGSAASFRYNRTDGTLALKETVVSGDETYTASGSTTIQTTCTDETTGPSPNWEIGQIYIWRKIDCEEVNATVAGTVA